MSQVTNLALFRARRGQSEARDNDSSDWSVSIGARRELKKQLQHNRPYLFWT